MKRRVVKMKKPSTSTKKTKIAKEKDEEPEHRLVAQLVMMHGFCCSLNKLIFSACLDKSFYEWSKKNAYQDAAGFYSVSANTFYSHFVNLGCICLLETSFTKNKWSHLIHVSTNNFEMNEISQEAISLCRGPKSLISQFELISKGKVVTNEQPSMESTTTKHVILAEMASSKDTENRKWIVKVRAV